MVMIPVPNGGRVWQAKGYGCDQISSFAQCPWPMARPAEDPEPTGIRSRFAGTAARPVFRRLPMRKLGKYRVVGPARPEEGGNLKHWMTVISRDHA